MGAGWWLWVGRIGAAMAVARRTAITEAVMKSMVGECWACS